jgi:hypothetical protein
MGMIAISSAATRPCKYRHENRKTSVAVDVPCGRRGDHPQHLLRLYVLGGQVDLVALPGEEPLFSQQLGHGRWVVGFGIND